MVLDCGCLATHLLPEPLEPSVPLPASLGSSSHRCCPQIPCPAEAFTTVRATSLLRTTDLLKLKKKNKQRFRVKSTLLLNLVMNFCSFFPFWFCSKHCCFRLCVIDQVSCHLWVSVCPSVEWGGHSCNCLPELQ